jgi:murein L,D-transpeptidase YcbB/YkuD
MLYTAVFLLSALASAPAFAADVDDREAIRLEIEQLRATGQLSVGPVDIASGEVLAELYERRGFTPGWQGSDDLEAVIRLVRASAADGLDPQDYHLEDLEQARDLLQDGTSFDAEQRAALDIGITDALIRLGYHQRFGKVNPYDLDPEWNFSRELLNRDPAGVMLDAMDAPSLEAAFLEIFPRPDLYRRLRAALEEHRRIAASGGWSAVPDGPTLRPGASDERLDALMHRLAVTGDLPGDAGNDVEVYGGALEEAVRAFQERHGLDADGIVGPATLRALNVPVEDRIDQIRVNLERARWVMDNLEDDFIIVNIAGFRVYVFRDRKEQWSSRAVVGKTYRKTPVFRSMMRYIVFNPDWTVPYSIATKDILPAVQRDPGYLAARGFIVKDRNGDAVDPATIDWSALSRRRFPYTLVQQPGTNNALGEIKFMFPNEHAVYLHDTPGKGLFGRAERTFSSGCVRVEHPFDFALQLLGPDGWDAASIEAERQTRKTRTVILKRPVPVLLLYWTVEVDAEGRTVFYEDVYERDGRILGALDSEYRIVAPGS